MPRNRHTVEQIITKLREAEVALSTGQPVAQACRTLGITEQLRDELLNRELFATLWEVQVLVERWRRHDNQIRPHRALGLRPPAPETIASQQCAYVPFDLVQPRGAGHWTLDFVADQLVNGPRFRALTVVDIFTRESLAIEVGQGLRGGHVVNVLNRLTAQRGAPTRLLSDNGSKFCSQLVDLWAYQHQVRIDCSRPGKPTDNAHVESFNATLRRECLNVYWFESLDDAKERIAAWRREDNESRLHRALQDRTPEEFAKRVAENHLSEPLITAGNSP